MSDRRKGCWDRRASLHTEDGYKKESCTVLCRPERRQDAATRAEFPKWIDAERIRRQVSEGSHAIYWIEGGFRAGLRYRRKEKP